MGIFDWENVKSAGRQLLGKTPEEAKSEELRSLEAQIQAKRYELEQLKKEILLASDDLELVEYGFFERKYKFSSSTIYKSKIDQLREEQKKAVSNGTAARITATLTFNNSVKQGEAIQKQLIKAAIRGFNGEADALLVKVSPSNLERKIQALQKSFDQLNKLYSKNCIELTKKYLNLKIKELELSVEYDLKLQQEKEILRAQREQEKEDKKLQAEIAAKRKQLAKDKSHYLQMIENVKTLLENASEEEKHKLNIQLQEYSNHLLEIEEIEEDIDYREGHATAGYVYVISNIGSFGEDVYKIGVTRRLDPLERIRELSSASVPFQFDVHALVFSEEAFALETELHNQLAKYKINKVNGRKEYFRVPFAKIKSILESHKELAIELTEEAEAFEFRQSIKLP